MMSKKKPMCAYELERQKNIKMMEMELGGLMSTVQNNAKVLAVQSKKSIQSQSSINPRKRKLSPIRRSNRIRKITDYAEENDIDEKGKVIKVKFTLPKNFKQLQMRNKIFYKALDDEDFINDSDEDYIYVPRKRKRGSTTGFVAKRPVSKITKAMIDNVHYESTNKLYDRNYGTTCHQCRQKTMDQKSYCRLKNCTTSRGLLCGFCLGNRYGEDVKEVLLNPKWACPYCRGICNCSICRNNKGLKPTGQLVQKALAKGFTCVQAYLEYKEGINGDQCVEFSDSDFEADDCDNTMNDISETTEMVIDRIYQEQKFPDIDVYVDDINKIIIN